MQTKNIDKKSVVKALLILIVSFLFFLSCSSDDDENVQVPKPRAYMRITFPEKKYITYESSCPFTFSFPKYSTIEFNEKIHNNPCWFNVHYKPFHAQLHISYKNINNDLNQLVEDTRELAIKHQIKASGLDQRQIAIRDKKVYGLVYDIKGNTASSLQFYLTDSSKHFIRGSLYFNVAPNIDSLQLVVDFLKKDIDHMMNTFKWKN